MKLTLTSLTIAATMFANGASAFEPDHLQELKDKGDCVNCDLEGANLLNANLDGANLERCNSLQYHHARRFSDLQWMLISRAIAFPCNGYF